MLFMHMRRVVNVISHQNGFILKNRGTQWDEPHWSTNRLTDNWGEKGRFGWRMRENLRESGHFGANFIVAR
jgi:hypothetical protein